MDKNKETSVWQHKNMAHQFNAIYWKIHGADYLTRAHHELLSPAFNNIVAAFRGMHVSPAKHSYAWLPRKCDYRDRRSDRRTDRRRTKWSLCAAMLCMRHKNETNSYFSGVCCNMVPGTYYINTCNFQILVVKDNNTCITNPECSQ